MGIIILPNSQSCYNDVIINIRHNAWHSSSYVVLWLVAQSCLTLCNPMDCSLPGSSVHRDSPGKNTAVGWHAVLFNDCI